MQVRLFRKKNKQTQTDEVANVILILIYLLEIRDREITYSPGLDILFRSI